MRPVLLVTALVACLGLAGCANLNPKNWNLFTPRKPRADGERIPPPETHPTEPTPIARVPVKGPANGVIAGRVIDVYNQLQPGTRIQLVAVDAKPGEKPIEAAADSQGYFVVQGLEPGRRYKVQAHGKRGEQALAGVTIASAPNVSVLIKISEDLAALEPLAPAGQPTEASKPGGSPPAAAGTVQPPRDQGRGPQPPAYLHEPDRGYADHVAPPGPGGAHEPKSTRLGTPGFTPPPPVRPDLQTDRISASNVPPTVDIRNPGAHPPALGAPRASAPAASPAERSASAVPAPVPACTLVGQRVEELALNDLQGQPYRLSESQSPLVLLDFWGTWCSPCVQGMPYLVDLQRRYGPRGLEIVGIAYEEGTMTEKIQRVNFVRQRQGANYRILLGEGDHCPVLTKLGVRSFPTLILLDGRGQILWRGEGLTDQNKTRLEQEIRRHLDIP